MDRPRDGRIGDAAEASAPPTLAVLSSRRAEILAVVRRHHGRSVAVFGSLARGEDRPGSDIDLLVEFEPGSSLLDPVQISDELTDLLGRRVDVVSRGGLTDRDDHIRREAIPL
jgi:predicted nucleotidyltransferase